jgi:hypothetical protein
MEQSASITKRGDLDGVKTRHESRLLASKPVAGSWKQRTKRLLKPKDKLENFNGRRIVVTRTLI